MMNKRVILVFIIVLVSILLALRSNSTNVGVLSPAQTTEFMKDNNVKEIASTKIENFTVVMFETENEIGHFVLSLDKDRKIQYIREAGIRKSTINPVSISYVTNKVCFISIYFNDKKMLEDANKISLQFTDGCIEIQEINNKSGIIIPLDSTKDIKGSYKTIIVYGKNGKVLYRGNCFS